MIIIIRHTPWGYDDPPEPTREAILTHALDAMTSEMREDGVELPEFIKYLGFGPADGACETFYIRIECSEELAEWARSHGWVPAN